MPRLLFVGSLVVLGCAGAEPQRLTASPVATSAAPIPPPAPSAAPPAPAPALPYPATRTTDTVDELFGTRVADPYRWLEDGASSEVQAWGKAQNALTRSVLDALPEREALRKRFRELFDIERVGAPLKRGQRYFWSQKDVGREKDAVFYRQGKNGERKPLLDPNTWSTDGSVSLGSYSVSWDGKLVTYQVKKNNSDEAVLETLEVATGKKLPEVIEGAKYTWHASWNRNSTGFYYVKVPPIGGAVTVAERPGLAEVRFHRIGDDPAKDAVVREPTHDPKTFQSITASRDGRVLIASVRHGWVSSDLYVQDPVRAPGQWSPVVMGNGVLYEADPYAGELYVLTNRDAPRFRVFRVDPKRAQDPAAWREIVAERPDTTIDRLSIVGKRLNLVTIRDAVQHLEVRELDGKLAYDVPLAEPGSVSPLIGNEDEDEAYFRAESFSRPPEIHEISVKTGKTKLYYQTKVPVDASRYTTEQRFATSRDGTRISYFLLHDRSKPLDGKAPALLYGYGGFSVSLTPTFSTSAFPWLERGGVFAIANLRGGGEYGEAWHQAGMRRAKQHVFDDFTAVATALIDDGVTKHDRLVIRGDSNGGLLVGAAITQHPELFRVALCGVPLLDMLRYHLYGSGKTWIEEYGSADDAEDFKALYAYSPYHHVTAGVRYPSVLLLSADSDDRVDPLHARKFAAALQARSAGGPVLLRIQEHAGHGGADKIQALVDERADAYAFALSQVAH
ncbi:MAG TPA: prolyl oligopeptidase family serine peptidase [Polyangiaceae bacterium]|nr:prolyl oligopeptidase family serine peptidase [Polyangiaceae bacterium]